MDFHSLLPHIIGHHDQQQDSSEGSRDLQETGQQLRVNEILPSQQPSQASGVATPMSPVAAVKRSKFGKQSITFDQLVTYMHVHVTAHIHVHTQSHSIVPRPLPRFQKIKMPGDETTKSCTRVPAKL